jgi:hypothetical protein
VTYHLTITVWNSKIENALPLLYTKPDILPCSILPSSVAKV